MAGNRPSLDEIFASRAPSSSRPSLDDIFSDKPEPSLLEAVARGGAQGVTAGFADELTGAGEAALDKLKGSDEGFGDLYRKHRDESRANYEAASAAHPVAYGLTEAAGAIAPMVAAPEFSGLKGADAAARMMGAGRAGALMGLGHSGGDLTSGDLRQAGDTAYDTAKGFIGGVAAGGVAEAAAPVLQKVGDAASNLAERLAVRHLRPTPQMARVYGREGLNDIGREALDSGAIQFGAKAETTAANLADLTDEVGAVKGDVVAGSSAKIDPKVVAARFDNEVIDPLRGTAENKELVRALEAKRDAFLENYAPGYKPGPRAPGTPTTITRHAEFIPKEPTTTTPFGEGFVDTQPLDPGIGLLDLDPPVAYQTPESTTTPPFQVDPKTGMPVKRIVERRLEAVPPVKPVPASAIEAEKMAVQDNINWKTDPTSKTGALRQYSGVLKDSVENAIQDPAFGASKRAFGNLKAAQGMADRTMSLTDSGNGLMGHLVDVGVGTEALHELANGNPVGLGMAGVRALTKGRVASSAAVTLDKISNVLQTMPQALGKFRAPLQAAAQRGSDSLAAAHYVLANQNPEYRETLKKTFGDFK